MLAGRAGGRPLGPLERRWGPEPGRRRGVWSLPAQFSVSLLFSGFLPPPWVFVPLSPVPLPAPSFSESLDPLSPPPFSISFSLSLCPLFLKSLPPFGGLSLPSKSLSPQSLCSLLSGELSLSLRFLSYLFGCLASSGPLSISFLVFGDNDCMCLHQVAASKCPRS